MENNEIMKKEESIGVTQSPQLDQLFTALAKAQGEMETASKDASNPFFKSNYSSLAEIVRASRPFLAKNGLCCFHRLYLSNGSLGQLSCILGHSSGQFIESRTSINPPKPDIQSLGSYISYLRRYTYSALIGVVNSDEDDDGEAAMGRERVTPKEIGELRYMLKDKTQDEINKLLEWAQCKKIEDFTREKYEALKKSYEKKNGGGT